MRNSQLEEICTSLPQLKIDLEQYKKQADVLLLMLGEKEEELEAMLSDMKEVKYLYSHQIEELLDKINPSSSSPSSSSSTTVVAISSSSSSVVVNSPHDGGGSNVVIGGGSSSNSSGSNNNNTSRISSGNSAVNLNGAIRLGKGRMAD